MILALLPAFRATEDPAPDGFVLSHEEGYLEMTLTLPDGTGTSTSPLAPGAFVPVLASVSRVHWQIWTHPDTGASEPRHHAVSPVSGVTVSFSASGDGSVDTASTPTDPEGRASVTFIASTSSSGFGASLVAEATGPDGTPAAASASLKFLVPPFIHIEHPEHLGCRNSWCHPLSTSNIPNICIYEQLEIHLNTSHSSPRFRSHATATLLCFLPILRHPRASDQPGLGPEHDL